MVRQVLPLSEDGEPSATDDNLFTMDEIKLEVMRARGAGGQASPNMVELVGSHELTSIPARQQNRIRRPSDSYTYWDNGVDAR